MSSHANKARPGAVRGRPPFQWSDELDAAYIAMRNQALSIEECAAKLGISNSVALKRAKALGINQRFNCGRTPGKKPSF